MFNAHVLNDASFETIDSKIQWRKYLIKLKISSLSRHKNMKNTISFYFCVVHICDIRRVREREKDVVFQYMYIRDIKQHNILCIQSVMYRTIKEQRINYSEVRDII